MFSHSSSSQAGGHCVVWLLGTLTHRQCFCALDQVAGCSIINSALVRVTVHHSALPLWLRSDAAAAAVALPGAWEHIADVRRYSNNDDDGSVADCQSAQCQRLHMRVDISPPENTCKLPCTPGSIAANAEHC